MTDTKEKSTFSLCYRLDYPAKTVLGTLSAKSTIAQLKTEVCKQLSLKSTALSTYDIRIIVFAKDVVLITDAMDNKVNTQLSPSPSLVVFCSVFLCFPPLMLCCLSSHRLLSKLVFKTSVSFPYPLLFQQNLKSKQRNPKKKTKNRKQHVIAIQALLLPTFSPN
jgi:hypothetical protein